MLKICKQYQAEKDLIDIWIYSCENWGAHQADKYLDEINTALQTITKHPDVGIKVDSIREGYSKFNVN